MGGRRKGQASPNQPLPHQASSSWRLWDGTPGYSARKKLINEGPGSPASAAINTANIWREEESLPWPDAEKNRLCLRIQLPAPSPPPGSSSHTIHPPRTFHSQSPEPGAASSPAQLGLTPGAPPQSQPPPRSSRIGVKRLESNQNSVPLGPFPNSDQIFVV